MSEPPVDAPSTSFLLDGDAPRLGGDGPGPSTHDAAPVHATPTMLPPVGPSHHQHPSPVFSASGPAPLLGSAELDARPTGDDGPTPSLPRTTTNGTLSPARGASPDHEALTPPAATAQPVPTDVAPATVPSPTLPAAAATTDPPTLPSTAPASSATTSSESADDDPDMSDETATAPHPMGHLMPQKSAPNEASRRAAEIRAAKKAKARKVKIGVAVGALVVAALAGPPIVGWVSDAINEAGSTDVEE